MERRLSTHQIVAIIDSIPTKVLLKAAQARRIELSQSLGKYATMKIASVCPYCKGGPMGVRQLWIHKRSCAKNPRKRIAKRAA